MNGSTRYVGIVKDVLKADKPSRRKNYHLEKLKSKLYGLPVDTKINIALTSSSVSGFNKLITPIGEEKLTNGTENYVGLGPEFLLFSLISYVKNNKEVFKTFNLKKNEAENFIVQGDISKSSEVINNINKEVGYTFWSIDAHISLKHDTKSPDDILSFINSITSSNTERNLLGILFYKHSSTGIDSFLKNHFHDVQKEYRNNGMSGYINMLSTLIMPKSYDLKRDIDSVIGVSELLSPIDKYILYKKVFFDYFTSNEKSELHDLYVRFVKEMHLVSDDDYWHRILKIFNKDMCNEKYIEQYPMLIENYSKGNYRAVIDLTSNKINRDLSHLDIKAKSVINYYGTEVDIDDGIFSSKFESNLISQISVLHLYPARYDTVIGFFEELNFRYYSFDFLSSLRPSIYSSYPFINNDTYICSCKESYALGFNITPRHLNSIINDQVGVNFSITEDSVSLSESRKERFRIQELISSGKISELDIKNELERLSAYKDITKSEFTFLSCNMYLKGGYIENIIDIISKSCISETSNVILYPLKEMVRIIEKEPSSYNKVSSLICIYLYYITRDSSYKTQTSEMLEDFLFSMDAEKPSDLFTDPEILNNRIYYYFFSEICRTEIMSDLLCFNSGKELILERLKILRHLINHQEDTPLLQEEEKNILSELLSHTLTLQHEKNKIYIDVDGIRKSQLNEYRIRFENLRLVRNIDSSLVESFFDDINSAEDSVNKTMNVRSHVYGSLYEKVIKDFITDSNFGLARSLSSEIRHGVLPNKLRSVFEGLKLITIVGLDGKYEPNIYWREYLGKIVNPDFVEHIDQSLKVFSRNIDELIERANTWPSISEEKNDDVSIFKFQIEPIKLDGFTNHLESTFLEFEFSDEERVNEVETSNLILSIEEYIWKDIEVYLLDMKKRLNEVLKIEFNKLIDEFKSHLHSTGSILTKLTGQLALANVHIIEEISKIESWFVRPNGYAEGQYSIEDMLSSSIESIKAIYNPQLININKAECLTESDDIFFSASEALGLVRALISIYQNCLSHGDMSTQTVINIKIEEERGIVVYNNIDDEKRQHIIDNDYIDKVSKFSPMSDYKKLVCEGGTGLYKIYRYLVDSSPSFGFSIALENNIFYQKVLT